MSDIENEQNGGYRSMKINAYSFLTALKAALLLAPKKGVKSCFSGIHLLGIDGGFLVESTDNYTYTRIKIDAEVDGPIDIVMPRSYCEKLIKFKVPAQAKHTLELQIDIAPFSVAVSFEGQTLRTDAVDCDYPDLSHSLVAECIGTASSSDKGINAEHLARVAKGMSMLAHPRFKGSSLVGGAGPAENFVFEVPTWHGEFPAISEPAVFVVCPMRL